MKQEFVASFGVAVICHALLLFGIRPGTPARPFTPGDDPSPVDVSLVEAAPPSPTPPVIEPNPTPEPMQPAPPPDIPAPAPEPAPPEKEEAMATPAPEPPREKPKPLPPLAQKHSKNAAPTSNAARSSPANSSAPANGPLGSPARYRSNPKPEYPPDARERHEEGLVLLSVEVTADGRASDVTLKRSSGHPSLDQAAIRGVRRWTFEPARAAGLPVSSRVDVPVRFSIAGPPR